MKKSLILGMLIVGMVLLAMTQVKSKDCGKTNNLKNEIALVHDNDKCGSCNGSGRQSCHICGGDGWNECNVCYGSGTTTDKDGNKQVCYRCDGKGKLECSNSRCSNGTILCSRCNGTGE